MSDFFDMPKTRLLLLIVFAILSIILFMTFNLRGNIQFALELRAVKLVSLIQVAVAIAISTVIFQTISHNRILTPSIMGMDALYILLQFSLVFFLGGVGFLALNPTAKFLGEVLLMMALVVLLFLPLIRFSKLLQLLLLTGIVFGVLFRSLSSLLARLIDPNDFVVVQHLSFANFNSVNDILLLPALLITIALLVFFWCQRHLLDVLLLGRTTSITLGIQWHVRIVILLIAVGILVSISTALVGPVTFLGLLVVALSDGVVKTRRHGVMFIASSAMAIILLVGGQAITDYVLGNKIVLPVLVEFAGGMVFLFLLLRQKLV